MVFTGGVGENQASAAGGACEGLEFMGIKLDAEKNKVRGEENGYLYRRFSGEGGGNSH